MWITDLKSGDKVITTTESGESVEFVFLRPAANRSMRVGVKCSRETHIKKTLDTQGQDKNANSI